MNLATRTLVLIASLVLAPLSSVASAAPVAKKDVYRCVDLKLTTMPQGYQSATLHDVVWNKTCDTNG